MLNEVGRAHVAHAVPILFQPAEVFRVWQATAACLRSALLAGGNVSLFRRSLSFSCSRRKPFKKIPASFHREAQVYDLRVPLFGVAPAFATTYGLDASIVEDLTVAFTPLPLRAVAEAAKVPPPVAAAVLHDIMRFVGQGLFEGRLLELDFPGVALVRVKRDRVMAVFDGAFTGELLAIDTRKWPGAIAAEARMLLVRATPPPPPAAASSAPAAARGGGGGGDACAAPQQQRRPSSAAAAPRREFNPPPFVNAPAPAGRTFDEMIDIRQSELSRRRRGQQQRAASVGSARPTSIALQAQQAQQQQQQRSASAAAALDSGALAVVYDESVPAAQLPPSPHGAGALRHETVYDMVMPHPADGATLSGSIAPLAASRAPVPLARPQWDPAFVAPVAVAAAPSVATARPSTGKRFASNLHPNTHVDVFAPVQACAAPRPLTASGASRFGKRRFQGRDQNQPTTVMGGAAVPLSGLVDVSQFE